MSLVKLSIYEQPLPSEKDHISFSEIKEWLECTYKHKLKYIDGFRDPDTVFTCFGTAIHAACEDYVKTRIMKPELALIIILEEWEKNNFEDKHIWMKRALNVLLLVPEWLENNFPGWECVNAEEELLEPIPNSKHTNVHFKGYIDAIIKYKDEYWLLDWKTMGINGWSDYKKKDESTLLQLVYYNIFWSIKSSIDPSKIKCAFILLNRETGFGAKTPIELYKIEIFDTHKRRGLEVIENMINSVKRKFAFKVVKEERYSPCKFCVFNGTPKCP